MSYADVLLFENPLPTMVRYRTAVLEGKHYPNCVEASLFVASLLAARRKTEEGYVIDPGIFPEKNFLQESILPSFRQVNPFLDKMPMIHGTNFIK